MKHVVMSEVKVHQFDRSHNDVELKRPSYRREYLWDANTIFYVNFVFHSKFLCFIQS